MECICFDKIDRNYYCYHPSQHLLVQSSNRDIRKSCETFSKLRVKTPERLSGVLIVNFEYISHLFHTFEQVSVSWEAPE